MNWENSNLNLLKLMTSCILSKSAYEFLCKKYDSAHFNEQMTGQLVNGYILIEHDTDSTTRNKLYTSIVIIKAMEFFRDPSEKNLYTLADIICEPKSDRTAPLDFLAQLRAVLCKKLSQELKVNGITTNTEQLKEMLFNYETLQGYSSYSQTNEYTNEKFYEELSAIIKEYVESINKSVLFEISKNYQLFSQNDEDDESELVYQFNLLKKRKLVKTEAVDSEADQSSKRPRICRSDTLIARPTLIDTSPYKNILHQRFCLRSPAIPLIPVAKTDQMDSDVFAPIYHAGDHECANNKAEDFNKSSSDKENSQMRLRTPEKTIRGKKKNRVIESEEEEADDEDAFDFIESPSEKAKRKSCDKKLKSVENTNAQASTHNKKSGGRIDSENSDADEFRSKETASKDSEWPIEEVSFSEPSKTAKKTKHVSNEEDEKATSDPSAKSLKPATSKESASRKISKLASAEAILNLEIDGSEEEDDEAEPIEKTTSKPGVKSLKPATSKMSGKESVSKKKGKTASEEISLSLGDESESQSNSDSGENNVKHSVKRRKRHISKRAWSEEETLILVMGVILYGKGNWARILVEFPDKLRGRNNVNLKDKYRNLEKFPRELQFYERKADLKIKAKAAQREGKSDLE